MNRLARQVWKHWPLDERVMYCQEANYVTVTAQEKKVGPIRLIGNSIDHTIRMACREIGFEIENSN